MGIPDWFRTGDSGLVVPDVMSGFGRVVPDWCRMGQVKYPDWFRTAGSRLVPDYPDWFRT